uniref:IP16849p n=1 Tax=Drosophila melanogaster TaxID=7227 RepID=A2VEG5_DROME|nr:IP16849p [Drosophila melanogaster]
MSRTSSRSLFLPLCLLVLSALNGPAAAASRVRVSSSTTMTRNIEEENGPPVLSESIMGTVGRLPCNVTPPIYEDRVALVIWYKVGLKTPIYSVDTRDSNFAQGTHWSDETYRERLSFHVEGRAGTLTIKSTTEDDTGEYRCRVDFQKSPTRNSKVNLTVIIPPESVIILDSKGVTIEDHTLGPYNEGSGINITCVAIGGRPQPRVTWLHGNTVYKNASVGQPLSERRVGNTLSLARLERRNLHMQLTCRAENNNLTTPIFTHSMVTTGDGLLQPVTCMGLVATSSAGASVPGPVPLAPQQQQQQQLTAANGGNGSIVGMGMSLYGSDVGKPQLLKTVPEEVHHQLNGEDILIAQDRNLGSGTRF